MPARVTTPEELRMEEKRKEIAASGLSTVVDAMPERRKRLLLALVAFPDKTERDILRIAGVAGVTKKSIFKEVGGKLSAVLKEFGITQADVARNIHQLMNATKAIRTRKAVYDKNGDFKGWEQGVEHVPDFPARQKATEMVAKLGDYFPAKKISARAHVDHSHSMMPRAEALLEQREQQQIMDTTAQVVTDAPVN